MTVLAVIGAVTLVTGLVGAAWLVASIADRDLKTTQRQDQLEPFYTPPAVLPPNPGDLIRAEPMDVKVPGGGTAYRVLYVSDTDQGVHRAVSGMVFVPDKPAPPGGRKVLAWAHGTVGLVDQCAPSRSGIPLQDSENWLNRAMEFGWAVTATDYTGLGTPGPHTYLVGQQEARDVVNSVRAVRAFTPAQAGKQWIVWGHSQGGHSALWTANLAPKLAPDLPLLGVGVAAPAAFLPEIVEKQWNNAIGWVIGPEALASWQTAYPQRNLTPMLTGEGRSLTQQIESECVRMGALEAVGLTKTGGVYFNQNPNLYPAAAKTIVEQVPKPPTQPMFMVQGTNDHIVLSPPNALLQEQWCKAGVKMTVEWIGGAGHMKIAINGAPMFSEWAHSVFAGKQPPVNCSFPPAVPPAALAEVTP